MSVIARTRPLRADHLFYAWSGIAAALLVFVGFARSYFLRAFFFTQGLSLLVHVHGALMTLWFVLFLAQVSLVAAHRTDLHRRLGTFGAVLAILLVIFGIATAFIAAARRAHSASHGPLMFLGLGSAVLLVFALMVGTAVLFRRRLDIHKRLMLLATLSILPPGIARIPIHFIQDNNVSVAFALIDLCIVAVIAIDTIRNRRLHAAFLWSAPLVIASEWLAYLGALTHAWTQFATQLVT